MPYITREDGERFVIPSYRDVLSIKKASLLKREIFLLASNYGEYIALQKKSVNQYEVAFSTDPGALLGETVWHFFKRPQDLIYCEAIPNTSEAILVIVKSGSVYLDGSFSIDSIPEELVIFQTQHNQFDIYLYGDVPISQTPTEGKFSFDAGSVKSFNILDKPVFPTLPVVKIFQLQLVDVALKAYGIGVFPIKQLSLAVIALGLLWMGWVYLTTHRKEIALPQVFVGVVNPYQVYIDALTSPNPANQIHQVVDDMALFFTIPGWYPNSVSWAGKGNNQVIASVKSQGARTNVLYDWAAKNNIKVELQPDGFYVRASSVSPNRLPPTRISKLDDVIANLIDRLSYIVLGNPLSIKRYTDKGKYFETELTIKFSDLSPTMLNVIGQQFKTLPLVLSDINMSVSNGRLSGSIVLTALGN
ncbi:MAG: hypothetical protein K0S27_634 [Gammaproteobacteria bacterium]|jgi:hypothetical protein|nr:hypothetical protein [Gammaproteobacteria bacterium]